MEGSSAFAFSKRVEVSTFGFFAISAVTKSMTLSADFAIDEISRVG